MPSVHDLLDKIHIIKDEAAYATFLQSLTDANIAKPVRVAFVNAHALNMCYGNQSFLNDLLACDYVLRDGSGMKILYKLLGREPGLNMNGTDLIPRILDEYKGSDVALLGTDSPYLDNAAQVIAGQGLNPSVVINGFHETPYYIEALKQKPVPLVILAMGMPKQEHVANMIALNVGAPGLIICGGAILDFIGGKVLRAPEIFRKFGMEWVYRLLQEPRRLFKRYVVGNFVFLYRAFFLSKSYKSALSESSVSMANLKVLHVVRQFAPAIGGLESYVYNMVQNQQKRGYDCQVLTLDKVFHGEAGDLPAVEIIDGIKIRRVGFFGKRRFFIPKVAPSYFSQFDLVHVHNTDMFYDYGALVAAVTKTPFFATTHGGFFHTKDFSAIKQVYFNVITRISSLFYKTIFAISQNDYDTFKGLNKQVVLQHNAIEPLGTEIVSGKDFLYIGRLAQHKNVAKVIEVFALLKSRYNIDGTFHVVGPEWDVTLADLTAVAAKYGVTDSVKFHGAATASRMREIAKNCGYFISASAFEGFGMSMLEGMSIGLIPLVHSNESFKELVTECALGLCTDFNDVDTTAKGINEAIARVTEDDRKRARSFALKFSWDGLIENTEKYYKDALR